MTIPARERTWHELPRSLVANVIAQSSGSLAGPLDRVDERRRDTDWLDDATRSRDALVVVVYETTQVEVTASGGLRWVSIDDVAALGDVVELRLLGTDTEKRARFSLEVGAPPDGVEVRNLRDVLGGLDELDADAVLEAVALANWHRRNSYCANCGAPTEVVDAGHSRACTSCSVRHFPRMDPAVIMLVSAGDRCVLGRRTGAPEGRFSTLAGFVEVGESAEHAVVREVSEESGLEVHAVSYRGSQPWPFPASLMLSFHAEADYRPVVASGEHAEVRWFEREELRTRLDEGSVSIPPPIAAGHQLIRGWLESD